MISFLGYAAVFFIVIAVLCFIWSSRALIISLVIFGTLAYLGTNYILRDADMSEKNVIKTTSKIGNKAWEWVDTTMMPFLVEFNNFSLTPRVDTSLVEPEPEPEGFVRK